MYTVGVITSSDAGARGEREDTSGARIKRLLAAPEFEHRAYVVVPDDRALIEQTHTSWAYDGHLDLIVTTGGTGLTDRDVVPEATRAVVDRLAPGIAEGMRAAGVAKTPMAMLSRGIAGMRGRTLIVNLPGSPKGVQEGLDVLLPILQNGENDDDSSSSPTSARDPCCSGSRMSRGSWHRAKPSCRPGRSRPDSWAAA